MENTSFKEYFDDENIEQDFESEYQVLEDSDFSFEEFDTKDVVNKTESDHRDTADFNKIDEPNEQLIDLDFIRETIGNTGSSDKKEKLKSIAKKLDVESISNYSDEVRKQNLFQLEYEQEEEPDEESIRLQNNFMDFLVLKNIAGRKKGFSYLNRIPSDALVDTGDVTEIIDYNEDGSEHKGSTIMIHKNNNEEISHIEVICTCGQRTLIKLDYEEE